MEGKKYCQSLILQIILLSGINWFDICLFLKGEKNNSHSDHNSRCYHQRFYIYKI